MQSIAQRKVFGPYAPLTSNNCTLHQGHGLHQPWAEGFSMPTRDCWVALSISDPYRVEKLFSDKIPTSFTWIAHKLIQKINNQQNIWLFIIANQIQINYIIFCIWFIRIFKQTLNLHSRLYTFERIIRNSYFTVKDLLNQPAIRVVMNDYIQVTYGM